MIDKEALNKKLAEWAGFKEGSIKKHYYFEVGGNRLPKWQEPGKEWHIKLPNFTQSLDACLKWLLPKSTIDDIRFILFASSWGAMSCVIEAMGERFQSWVGYPSQTITPELFAMSFCLAFEELIDKEEWIG